MEARTAEMTRDLRDSLETVQQTPLDGPRSHHVDAVVDRIIGATDGERVNVLSAFQSCI